MAKDVCARCDGHREHDAPMASYCKQCGKAYQRERYAKTRLMQGHLVQSRSESDTSAYEPRKVTEKEQTQRQAYADLVRAGSSGHCMFCTVLTEPEPLRPIYQIAPTIIDPATNMQRFATTDVVVALACKNCADTASKIIRTGPAATGALLKCLLWNIGSHASQAPLPSFNSHNNGPVVP